MMKYLNVKDNFKIYLENKTNLMPSSIEIYSKIINEFVDSYGIEPNIKNLNDFILLKYKHRQTNVKCAIKYFLKFRWKHKNIYKQLIKIKPKPVLKKNNYINEEQAIQLISYIRNNEHKLIAKIQYFTGAKASEVIGILKENIVLENNEKRIRINIVCKGDKINIIYLDDKLWYELNEYIRTEGPYLFIRTPIELKDKELWKKIETYYKKYYESLKESANNLDLNIATHDLRKSFAKSLKNDGVDMWDVKVALRHKNIATTKNILKNVSEKIATTMLKHQEKI